jgi:hypothetical protein
METKKLFCSVCRNNFSQAIIRGKRSPDDYRRVRVASKISDVKFQCVCLNCGREWLSRSPEASMLYQSSCGIT